MAEGRVTAWSDVRAGAAVVAWRTGNVAVTVAVGLILVVVLQEL